MSIDLNKLMNYKSLAYRASNIAQLKKSTKSYWQKLEKLALLQQLKIWIILKLKLWIS